MPAGLMENDNMFSVRQVPWHKLGVVLDEPPKGIDDALEKSGLDWEVIQVPVKYDNPVTGETVVDPDARWNLHGRTGERLGRVTKDYRVLQNREAFAFLANLIGSDMHWETAMSLHNGRHVIVTVSLPDWIEIGGDATKMYGMISNHHGGWQSIVAKAIATRVVCQNTFNIAMGEALPSMKIRHAGDPQARLLEARQVLGMTIDYGKQFKELGDRLASQKFTDAKMKKLVNELWPTEGPAVKGDLTARQIENRIDHQNHVQWMWREGITCNAKANAPGTAWTAFNAATEYIDYGTTDNDEKELNFVKMLDDGTKLKRKALDVTVELAGVAV